MDLWLYWVHCSSKVEIPILMVLTFNPNPNLIINHIVVTCKQSLKRGFMVIFRVQHSLKEMGWEETIHIIN